MPTRTELAPSHPIVVLMTFPTSEEAGRIASILVQERLVACVNIVPQVRSLFIWDGTLQDVAEVLAVAKTTVASLESVVHRVKSLHTYTVPEVIGIPILGGSDAYLDWVKTAVSGINSATDSTS